MRISLFGKKPPKSPIERNDDTDNHIRNILQHLKLIEPKTKDSPLEAFSTHFNNLNTSKLTEGLLRNMEQARAQTKKPLKPHSISLPTKVMNAQRQPKKWLK